MTRRNRLVNIASGVSAGALAWALASAATALPGTPTIFDSSGGMGTAADFVPGPGTLVIDQNHERVVIDWTSFNIAPGETVTFQQDQANWIAFNRVDAASFTTIDGALNATGSVWIFSPAGMLIGSNANINVGSFVASLGVFNNFEANQAMGLGDQGVFIGYDPGPVNENLLSIDAGANIAAADFIILHALNIDTAGDLTTPGGVGFLIGESAGIDFNAGSSSGIVLTNMYAAGDASQRGTPSFDHTGTTTAGWVDLSFAQLFEADYQLIINLDGVISASAAESGLINRPVDTAIWAGGLNSVTGLADGREVLINVLGDVSSTAGEIHFQSTDIFFALGSTVDSGSQFKTFVYGDITVQGDIEAAGQITMHSQAEYASIVIESTGTIESTGSGIVDISGNRDHAYVEVFGQVTGTQTVNIRSKGDVYIGSTAVITGDSDDNGGADQGVTIVSGLGFDFTLQTMTSIGAGDATVAAGAQLISGGVNSPDRGFVTANNGDIYFAGSFVGSRFSLAGNGDIVMSGDITSTELVQIVGSTFNQPNVGGDITITGTIAADDRVNIIAPNGSITIEGTADILADADGVPTTGVFGELTDDGLYVQAAGVIVTEDGSLLQSGPDGLSYIVIHSTAGEDEVGFTQAAVDLSGDVLGGAMNIFADAGSIRIRDGATVEATQGLAVEADVYFVLESGATLMAGTDLIAPLDPVEWPYADLYNNASAKIQAQDVAIYGDVIADRLVIVAWNDSGAPVLIGGEDGGANVDGYDLGAQFFLTDEEFGNLQSTEIVIIAGGDGASTDVPDSDIYIRDLTIPDGVADLAFGTSADNAIVITGIVAPETGGQTDLHVGFVIKDHPDYDVASFIPGEILIAGSLGTATNPFGSVTLIAEGDILMGSEEFLLAALEDEAFDAELNQDDLEVHLDHVFVASNRLTLSSNGRIIQQNTGDEGEFAGLLIGAPEDGEFLIADQPDIDGLVIDGETISVVGPTKVQLFGSFVGQSQSQEPVEGREVALNEFLLDPAFEANIAYRINGCAFGGAQCGVGGSETPVFESPTEVPQQEIVETEEAEDEQTAEASEDSDDSAFIPSLIAPNSDRAYEDERLGEPVTGSGNEDLWFGSRDGVQP